MAPPSERGPTFGAWVRARRRALDLRQADLAVAANCSTITVRKIEADERRPSRQMAECLADVLDLGDHRDAFLAAASGRTGSSARSERDPLAPVPLTPLIGRGRELDELEGLVFGAPPSRLVTISGPPGVGKTRLALEVLRRAGRRLPGRCVYVPLAAVAAPVDLAAQMAASINLPPAPGVDRDTLLRNWVSRGPALVVLDDADSIDVGAPGLLDLLRTTEELRAVVTSRSPLEVTAETEYPLAPLGDDAVDLFRSRARAVGRAASVDADLESVAEICRAVDGLPLAVELAAGRLRDLTLAELLRELTGSDGVAALRSRAPDRAERQRTMAAALRSSTDALTEPLASALHTAAVFPSQFSDSAADAVAATGSGQLEPLIDLCRLSLLQRDASGRFGMLTVVRSYVLAGLDTAVVGELRRRHAEWAATALESWSPGLDAWPEADALERLRSLCADAVAAMSWSFAPGGRPELGERCVAAIAPLWLFEGRWLELDHWTTRSIECEPEPAARLASTYARGASAWARGDLQVAMALLTDVAELSAAADDTSSLKPDPRWRLEALGQLSMCVLLSGDVDRARSLLAECGAAYGALADLEGRAFTAVRSVWAALAAGDIDGAFGAADLASELYGLSGSGWGMATAHAMRGEVLAAVGRFDESLAAYHRGLDGMVAIGADWFAIPRLAGIARALSRVGRYADAARACGMVDAWNEQLGAPMFPLAQPSLAAARSDAAAALGPACERFVQEGRLMERSPSALTRWLGLRPL